MKILGTGMRGLVGSRVRELLKDKYEFENLDRTSGIDITDKEKTAAAIKNSSAQIVLHLAAKTDVDGCEKDKDLGENSEAWKINVLGTKNVADACLEAGKKMIYVSTDFVFDGEVVENEYYTEESVPNPINFYAKTKYEGEKVVQKNGDNWMIVRLAYPYRATFPKNDFMRAILTRLKTGQKVAAIVDHIFCPTFIDDTALAFDTLISNNAKGIFHAVGGQALSPYDAALLIAKEFNLDTSLISKTTREAFFKDRAPRPFRLALRNDKIEKLSVNMKTFEEGLRKIKEQLATSG